MIDNVARGAMVRGKVNGQRSETTIAGQPKRRILVKHFPVEVNTNVGLHVFGTVVEHLGGVDAFGDGPGRHHIVHDALLKLFRHVVQLHKLANVAEHVVVASCC